MDLLLQALLLPVRLAYRLLGPAAMRHLDERIDFGQVIRHPVAALAQALPGAASGLALLCVAAPVAYKLRQQQRR